MTSSRLTRRRCQRGGGRTLVLLLLALPATMAPAQPFVAGFARFPRGEANVDDGATGGRLLLNELNCVACHAAPAAWTERLPGRGRIALAGAGGRLAPGTLARFIADPHGFKPGTVMPRLAAVGRDDATAIAAYLATLATPPGNPRSFPVGDATRGHVLFESVGCVACHAPAGVTAPAGGAPLALGGHYSAPALAAFLQDPLVVRPAGRMPATDLSDQEASDLAAFLRRDATGPGTAPPPAETSGEAARGRELFHGIGCAACHDAGAGSSPSAPARAPALAEVQVDRGCLAERPPARAPDFALDPRQRRALRLAVRTLQAGPPPTLSAEQAVTEIFERLNCYACHEWRGRGGVAPDRIGFFTGAGGAAETLGELGHLPPNLDTAGRKLTPAWLAKLLWEGGGGVRPYLSARMPRFGAAATRNLVPLLAEASRPARPLAIDVSGTKGNHRAATGRTLIGTGEGGLGCVSCHGLREREPAGVRAINLTHTRERLNPEYFKALLLDPQGVQPGTIMPPLFAGRRSAAGEIESIWTYLREIDQSPRLPPGLERADSFELKPAVEGRPIVFRTFLVGAGMQAIAVGYPENLHVAFDAHEVRWALAWRGRFLDAVSNWEERHNPPVKPLGDAPRLLPAHAPLVRASEAAASWPGEHGPAPGLAFKGYRLARDGVPTFLYRIGDVEVEDTLRPAADGKILERTLVARGGTGAWLFRGLGPGAEPVPVDWEKGTTVIREMISP